MKLEPGMKLQLRNEAGHPVPVTVTEIKDDVVVLDANHDLAGKELIFDIELVEIKGSVKCIFLIFHFSQGWRFKPC